MKYLKKAGYFVALLVFLFLVLGPFIWTFVISITPEYAMFAKTTELLPEAVTFGNYAEIFGGGRRGGLVLTGITNSLKAVLSTLIVGIPICMMSAYALSRMEFKGRKLIKNLLLNYDGHSGNGNNCTAVSLVCGKGTVQLFCHDT